MNIVMRTKVVLLLPPPKHCGYQLSSQTSRWTEIYEVNQPSSSYLFTVSSCGAAVKTHTFHNTHWFCVNRYVSKEVSVKSG